MRISDWSSDVCSSDLQLHIRCAGNAADDFLQFLATGDQLVEIVTEELDRYVRTDPGNQLVHPHLHGLGKLVRSEEHTSELQSLMRISYAVFCLKKKKQINNTTQILTHTRSQIKHTYIHS